MNIYSDWFDLGVWFNRFTYQNIQTEVGEYTAPGVTTHLEVQTGIWKHKPFYNTR